MLKDFPELELEVVWVTVVVLVVVDVVVEVLVTVEVVVKELVVVEVVVWVMVVVVVVVDEPLPDVMVVTASTVYWAVAESPLVSDAVIVCAPRPDASGIVIVMLKAPEEVD